MKDRLIIGTDDAGRGCIIGPLCIGGVSAPASMEERFKEMGVKDSKLLTPQSRETLYGGIKEIVPASVVLKIPPREVDEYVRHRKKHTKLNYLEAIYMARVINELEGEIAYVDASDTNVERYAEQIEGHLTRKVKLVSTHFADRIFPVVSAASILAKVERDREIAALEKVHGDFGSGYPSDPRTIEFLERWMEKHGEAPPFSRLTWKTWKRIDPGEDRALQGRLDS
ncbi:MAG TPA: ribonuclease HII [Conexivisphaerales archaeon]|nr:ribonuclease HII [Conexivisphaerales archaeon]